MTSLWERRSSEYVAIVERSSRADSVNGVLIARNATVVVRFSPVASCGARDLGDVHHGISLRNLRQEAVLRHERLALAPSHQASLESEHPTGARARRWHTQAHERLHRLHPL